MDSVTALTPEAERELRALRRRAYGPDPSSPLDGHELARLSELEAAVRTRGLRPARPAEPPRASAASAPAAAPAPAPLEPSPLVAEAPTQRGPVTAPDASRASSVTRPWWRRRATWVAGVGGIAVGVGATLGILSLTTRAPDQVLHRVSTEVASSTPIPSGLGSVAGDPDSLELFGQWEGLTVWTMRSAEDAPCLMLTVDDGLVDWRCAVSGFDPQIDFWLFRGVRDAMDTELPVGTTVRFLARGDAVDIWVDRPQEDLESAIRGR